MMTQDGEVQMPAQRKLIYGVAINDSEQPVSKRQRIICPFYQAWVNVLERCYSSEFHKSRPTYIGCTTSKEWLLFSNFKLWMVKQDWKGKHLDKDIIFPGNKHYSSENCVFVTLKLNNLLVDHGAKRGKYPIGVSFDDTTLNKFKACCNVDGKTKTLGRFKTPQEANNIYREFKSKLIVSVAKQQSDIRLKNGLLKHAELIRGLV